LCLFTLNVCNISKPKAAALVRAWAEIDSKSDAELLVRSLQPFCHCRYDESANLYSILLVSDRVLLAHEAEGLDLDIRVLGEGVTEQAAWEAALTQVTTL